MADEAEWAEIALGLVQQVIAFALNAKQEFPTLLGVLAIRYPALSAEQRWSGNKQELSSKLDHYD